MEDVKPSADRGQLHVACTWPQNQDGELYTKVGDEIYRKIDGGLQVQSAQMEFVVRPGDQI